ncbi:PREDICTED: uncharacterized protein LOC106815638 [Priapulus caudatus]|uniref:Uncharacterized protein LOC106815638 n=1 Tax=Priapulus caudatus TaxID=37621 RepID=A0ABM1ETU3_PRICU|nr:PREDICTED: uncharacterized protein LOC106815638 [Priapulus caudatus]
MPSYCCVPGCKSAKACHKFPANPNLNYKWRVAVRRVKDTTENLWKPMMHSKVCSDHFREDDYTSTFKLQVLEIGDGGKALWETQILRHLQRRSAVSPQSQTPPRDIRSSKPTGHHYNGRRAAGCQRQTT